MYSKYDKSSIFCNETNYSICYENITWGLAGLIITYLKNFIFDDDCIACQKHGKHGDKKILIDSVLCVLVLMGFELPFTGADVATTTFIFCSCQNWHVWVQCLFFNQPILPHWVYIINIYLYIYYTFYMHFSVQKISIDWCCGWHFN